MEQIIGACAPVSHRLSMPKVDKEWSTYWKKDDSAEKERECAFSVDLHNAASITLNECDEDVEC